MAKGTDPNDQTAGRAGPRVRLTFRKHPVAYVCTCVGLVILTAVLIANAWLRTRDHPNAPSWLERAAFVAVCTVGLAGWVFMLRRVAREFRTEPSISRKRANLWRGIRFVAFSSAAYATLAGGFCIAVAKLISEAHQDAARWAMCGALWSLAAVFLFWSIRWIRGKIRRAQGKCVRCEYLLRGLIEPRCPECGTPFNPADLEEVSTARAEVEDRRGE